MQWANRDETRILASPKENAECPLCNEKVISKCGVIKVWHWAHESKKDCDSWGENETQWHINWKNEFPKEQQEFTMGRHRADIRTSSRWIIELQNTPLSSDNIEDRETYYRKMIWLLNGGTLAKGLRIRNKKGTITFRWKNPPKSWWFAKKDIYIDLSEIVFKLKDKLQQYITGRLQHTTPVYEEIAYEYYTSEGEHVEVSYPKICDYVNTTNIEIKNIETMINLFSNNLFLIKKLYKKIPCGGWGYLISKKEFLKRMKDGRR